MKISRRYFTVGSASLLLTAASPYKLLANNSQKKKNLIVIMLRGAMDGLSAVPYIHDIHLPLPWVISDPVDLQHPSTYF